VSLTVRVLLQGHSCPLWVVMWVLVAKWNVLDVLPQGWRISEVKLIWKPLFCREQGWVTQNDIGQVDMWRSETASFMKIAVTHPYTRFYNDAVFTYASKYALSYFSCITWYSSSIFFWPYFFLSALRDWTQDLTLDRQRLDHLRHTSSSFCSDYFGDGISWTICRAGLKPWTSGSQPPK
jgi:hypothetical protein